LVPYRPYGLLVSDICPEFLSKTRRLVSVYH